MAGKGPQSGKRIAKYGAIQTRFREIGCYAHAREGVNAVIPCWGNNLGLQSGRRLATEHRKQSPEPSAPRARGCPWKHSTGPRTADGKARSSGNAWKGGHREVLRKLARLLEAHRQTLKR